MTVRVLLAVSDRRQEADLLAALRGGHGGAELRRRCVDLADVLAAAATGSADVAVLSGSLRRLDRDAVATLRRQGVEVVVVTDQQDSSSGPWTAWGVRAVVGPDPQEVLRAVLAGPSSVAQSREPSAGQWADPGVDPWVDPARAPGHVVAVWGPTGAPGRTTVAVTVADELSRLGHDTLLADVDTYGASVAQVLGLLDDTSGLASLTRLAATGRLDAATCARAAVALPSGLHVLTGVARPDRWVELRGDSLQAVWSSAASTHAFVVLDCAFGLGGGLGSWPAEVGPPDRDEATLASLAVADTVLAVGSADPVGLVRLARDLPAVVERAPTAKVRVVVTRCRRGAVGRDPRRAVPTVVSPVLSDLAVRHGARVGTDVHLVPDGRADLDSSLLSGRTLAESAPGSPARLALLELAESVVAQTGTPVSPVARRSRRRLRRAG
jgi:MinD-like ATPase involved in chromosome partitioning or flagellar assembly